MMPFDCHRGLRTQQGYAAQGIDTLVQSAGAAACAVMDGGRTFQPGRAMRAAAGVKALRGAIAACVLAAVSACGGGSQPPAPALPVVTVAHPVAANITDWDEYTGRIEPVETVEVRARVSGYLQSTHFDEGGMVAEGDLLFVIDPRPYRAILQAAEAERTRARVRLELAGNDRERAERLFKSRAISEEEFDARTQEQRETAAALEAAEAAVSAAQLNVDFTEVRAPIGGRIGRLLVTRGNLISGGTEGSTLLTTIVSVDPVHVAFTGDEREYLKYSRLNLDGSRPSSRDFANPVRIRLADEKEFVRQGRMDFVGNVLEQGSGTIQGRALFANSDGLLTPGLFVTVQLLGRGPYAALLIPDEAIGADQSRAFVYVVGEGNVAERRMIEVGRIEANLRVVRSGITAEDRVVINGLPRVRAGSRVDPQLVEIPRLAAPGADTVAADAAAPAAVAR
jgi:RND family efflux transporter MFP subunit